MSIIKVARHVCRTGYWQANHRPVSPLAVETVADTTRATVGVAIDQEDQERQFYVTALAITDDARLYAFVAWSEYRDGLEELLGVARRTLGSER